jgi:predicted HTH domain antitoxin
MKKEIGALVRAGYYTSKSDVVRDALRSFLCSKKKLRIAAAVELYKDGEVTLGKAAEIAGLRIIDFKELLVNLGYKRTITTSKSDIREADELVKQMR